MKPQEFFDLLESSTAGSKFVAPMWVDGMEAQPVVLHCIESTVETRTFKVFSHGVEIREVKATKKGDLWVPN